MDRHLPPVVRALRQTLFFKYPLADIYSCREKPSNGCEYVYVYDNKRLVIIEWVPMKGFGVYSRLGGCWCENEIVISRVIPKLDEALYDPFYDDWGGDREVQGLIVIPSDGTQA